LPPHGPTCRPIPPPPHTHTHCACCCGSMCKLAKTLNSTSHSHHPPECVEPQAQAVALHGHMGASGARQVLNIAGSPERNRVLRHIPARKRTQSHRCQRNIHASVGLMLAIIPAALCKTSPVTCCNPRPRAIKPSMITKLSNLPTPPPPPHPHTPIRPCNTTPVHCTHFQCLSCRRCLCSGLVLSALYMASATASMDQGLTRMAPDRLGEHPTNSAAGCVCVGGGMGTTQSSSSSSM
jgi:hypothetical protein